MFRYAELILKRGTYLPSFSSSLIPILAFTEAHLQRLGKLPGRNQKNPDPSHQ